MDLFTTTKTLINSSEDEMGRGQTKVEEEEEDEEEAKTPSTKNSRGVGTKKKDLFSNELNLFLQIVNLIYLFYHFFSPHSLSSQFIRSEPNLN